jgi:hypothetical protein
LPVLVHYALLELGGVEAPAGSAEAPWPAWPSEVGLSTRPAAAGSATLILRGKIPGAQAQGGRRRPNAQQLRIEFHGSFSFQQVRLCVHSFVSRGGTTGRPPLFTPHFDTTNVKRRLRDWKKSMKKPAQHALTT